MEKPLKRQRLPKSDSIEELARFWDTHEVTDFDGQLEEVAEPVFVRAKGASVSIDLQPDEVQHLKKIAQSKGVTEASVLHRWIVERLDESRRPGRQRTRVAQPAGREARRG